LTIEIKSPNNRFRDILCTRVHGIFYECRTNKESLALLYSRERSNLFWQVLTCLVHHIGGQLRNICSTEETIKFQHVSIVGVERRLRLSRLRLRCRRELEVVVYLESWLSFQRFPEHIFHSFLRLLIAKHIFRHFQTTSSPSLPRLCFESQPFLRDFQTTSFPLFYKFSLRNAFCKRFPPSFQASFSHSVRVLIFSEKRFLHKSFFKYVSAFGWLVGCFCLFFLF